VNLQSGLGAKGHASDDTFRSIEDLYGSFYNDVLIGNGAYNEINGYGGNDVVRGGAGGDFLDGASGVDALDYRDSAAGVIVNLFTLRAGGGDAQGDQFVNFENIYGSDHADTLVGDPLANLLLGNAGNDMASGAGGNDTVHGQDGNDSLLGGLGNDTLHGGAGNDLLNGGGQADRLYGAEGADRFRYLATTDSAPGAQRDTIEDFSRAQHDRIDLAGIDANTAAAGNQAFTFRGTGGFTGVNGQLQYVVSAGDAIVRGDVNGDKVADFSIIVADETSLLATDFIL
jgi:Ca2+-binding RTX toxin-like protein